jgi:hypothetical protein
MVNAFSTSTPRIISAKNDEIFPLPSMNRIWNKYMTVATTSKHPYYPLDVKLSGEYVENDWSVSSLITAFGALWTLLLGVTLVAVRRVNCRLSATDQALVLWFVLSKFPPLEWLWSNLTAWQRDRSISSSKDTSSTTMPGWQACRTSSVSCGRSMPYLIPDICPLIHFC